MRHTLFDRFLVKDGIFFLGPSFASTMAFRLIFAFHSSFMKEKRLSHEKQRDKV